MVASRSGSLGDRPQLALIEVQVDKTIRQPDGNPPKDVTVLHFVDSETWQPPPAMMPTGIVVGRPPLVATRWKVRLWEPKLWVEVHEEGFPKLGSAFACRYGKCRVARILPAIELRPIDSNTLVSKSSEYWVVVAKDACKSLAVAEGAVVHGNLISCKGSQRGSLRARLTRIAPSSLAESLPL